MGRPRDKAYEEVALTEPCPCGSGQTYKRCCKKRLFRWERNGRGELHRSLKLTPEANDIIQRNFAEFEETFGRKPRKNDPVFFQSYYVSDRDLRRQALDAMKAAGIRPILAYIYRKTGRIVRDVRLLTPEEQAEYEAVCDEYDDAVEAGVDPNSLGYPEYIDGKLLDELQKTHIVGGYFIENHFNKYRKVSEDIDIVEVVAAAMTINFVRCLKSVHVLLQNDISYDAYNLLRSMYENYLIIKYVYSNPSQAKAFYAQLGVELDTHEYALSRSGDPIQSRIIEKSTGIEYDIPSRWKMASSLDVVDQKIYSELYRSFSSFSHSDMSNLAIFLRDGKFDYHNQEFTMDATIKCHLLCLLMFSCLRQNATCKMFLKKDLAFLCERTFMSILMAVKYLEIIERQYLPEIGWSILTAAMENDRGLREIFEIVRAGWDQAGDANASSVVGG